MQKLAVVPGAPERPLVATIRLVALTEDARQALGDTEYIAIERFPFRVGRESRSLLTKFSMSLDRRLGSSPQLNDLYIVERDQFVHVSREHFLIDMDDEGYYLADRGSVCGTIVAGKKVGGDRTGGRIRLRDHDVIIVGTSSSPFVFKFRIG